MILIFVLIKTIANKVSHNLDLDKEGSMLASKLLNRGRFKWDATGAIFLKDEQSNPHKVLVDLWEEQNTKDLQDEQLIQVYGAAFQSIERSCLSTLSIVTIKVVIDRILHLGSEKYSILSLATFEASGLSLKGLNQNNKNYKTEELKDALSYLLVEFLTVIGNITSDVLTTKLHNKLMEVTKESALNVLEVQNLHEMNSVKKRGER